MAGITNVIALCPKKGSISCIALLRSKLEYFVSMVSVGFSRKITGVEALNLPSILEVEEYLLSKCVFIRNSSRKM